MKTFEVFIAGMIMGAFVMQWFRAWFKPTPKVIPAPEVPVARILPRPIPSHVSEGRILVNETRVDFLNDREYTPARVDGYHREPNRGNYYLVTFNIGTLAETRRWVPDTYVWERGELRLRDIA